MQSTGIVPIPALRLKNNQVKSPERANNPQNKGAAAIVKTVPHLGCVSQDSEPSELPESVKYRGNPRHKVLGSIRRVRFTKSTLRHASIRENKGPSLGQRQVKIPYQRSPNAVKFEDRSHEKRLIDNSDAKENDKTTFYSPAEECFLPVSETQERKESLW